MFDGEVQSGPDIADDASPCDGAGVRASRDGPTRSPLSPDVSLDAKDPGRSSAATSNIGALPALAISGRSAETSSSGTRTRSYSFDSPGDRNDGSGSVSPGVLPAGVDVGSSGSTGAALGTSGGTATVEGSD